MSCAKLGTLSTAAGGDDADTDTDADGIDIGADVDSKSLDFALMVSDEGTVMVAGSLSGGRPIKFAVDSDDLRLMLWFCEL